MIRFGFFAVTAGVLVSLTAMANKVNNEPELGQVNWSRDLAAALAVAGREHKPVFLLFQEIPGCSTCTSFGKEVLSNRLLVAAIESAAVPVVVRNNVGGKEGEILKRFGEPAWNNPVVRLLDANGKDLLSRKDGVYDAHGIATRLIDALEAMQAPVPGYLRIARDESDPKTETVVFAMHCFWEGEAVLAAVPGVVATRAVFAGGAEAVEVAFLPASITKPDLTAQAQQKSCRPVSAGSLRAAPPSDQQHSLANTPYAQLELTPMQRGKVHSALTLGTNPQVWLTPAQRARVEK